MRGEYATVATTGSFVKVCIVWNRTQLLRLLRIGEMERGEAMCDNFHFMVVMRANSMLGW